MANEQTKVAEIPTKITIGGVEYSVAETPELKELVNNVRKAVFSEEKNKVKSTIDELRTQINALNKASIDFDFDGFKEEIISAVEERIVAPIQMAIKNELLPITQDTERRQKDSINDYRNKVIQENQGKCFPEFVVGKTIEEIDASLAQSIEAFSNHILKYPEVAEKYGAINLNGHNVNKQTVENNNSSTNNTTNEAPKKIKEVPKTTTTEEQNLPEISKMSGTQFKDKREELKAKLEEQFG